MGNYIAKGYKPSGTENNVGAYKLLKDKILASVLALGLAGCTARYIDVNLQFKSLEDPTKTYTQSFEVGRKVAVENLSEYLDRPWDALPWNRYLFDRVYHTESWKEADKVICERGGLRKAVEQILTDMYKGGLFPENPQFADKINAAACGKDRSQRGVSNALNESLTPSYISALTSNLEERIGNDESFRVKEFDGYILEAVKVESNEKLGPEVRFALRRTRDGMIIGGFTVGLIAATGGLSGGGGAAPIIHIGGK